MSKLLIFGDPVGSHSLDAIESGWKPEDITVVETSPRYAFAVQCIDDRINVILDDENLTKTDKLIDEKMRFDVSLGNPPYSDTSSQSTNNGNLDSKFFLQAIKLADTSSLIIRAKHFTDPRSTFRKTLFGSGKLSTIEYVDPRVFGISYVIVTCIVTYDQNHSGPCKVTYNNGEVEYVDLTKDTLIFLENPNKVKVKNSLADRWVRGKVNRNKIDNNPDGFDIVEVGGTGDDPVISKTKEGRAVAINTYGVVTNVVNGGDQLGRVFIKPYGAAISSSVICLTADTEEEAIVLHNYLLSEECCEAIRANKHTPVASKELFSYIPDPLV